VPCRLDAVNWVKECHAPEAPKSLAVVHSLEAYRFNKEANEENEVDFEAAGSRLSFASFA